MYGQALGDGVIQDGGLPGVGGGAGGSLAERRRMLHGDSNPLASREPESGGGGGGEGDDVVDTAHVTLAVPLTEAELAAEVAQAQTTTQQGAQAAGGCVALSRSQMCPLVAGAHPSWDLCPAHTQVGAHTHQARSPKRTTVHGACMGLFSGGARPRLPGREVDEDGLVVVHAQQKVEP
jgi:hypothetical protein